MTALACGAALAGCGSTEHGRTRARSAQPPAPGSPRRYKPGGRHRHRPPHSIYNDEIDEDIIGIPYRQVVALFGRPLDRRKTRSGECVYYRVVGEPNGGWEFCIRRGVVESALGSFARREFLAEKRSGKPS